MKRTRLSSIMVGGLVSLMLLAICLFVVLGPREAAYGQSGCPQGYTLTPCSNSPYEDGNCTCYAWDRARASAIWNSYFPPDLGDAHLWDDSAIDDGYAVGTLPYPNAIAVFEPYDPSKPCEYDPDDDEWWEGCGHVGYVESVEVGAQGNPFTVAHMNYCNCNGCALHCVHRDPFASDDFAAAEGLHFVYAPDPQEPYLFQISDTGVTPEEPLYPSNMLTFYMQVWYRGPEPARFWYYVRFRDPNGDTFWMDSKGYGSVHNPGDWGPLIIDIGEAWEEECPGITGEWYWLEQLFFEVEGDDTLRPILPICPADGDCARQKKPVCVVAASGGSMVTTGSSSCGPEPTPVPSQPPPPWPTVEPPPQPTNTPTPEPPPDRSQCQDESKTGVYLYKDTNYEGSCAFFVDDHPNLGDTPVGDNGASSIRINGEYSVKLYGDINYGGPYEEVNASEADLGWRSLGNQFSSIKLHATQHCSDESVPGVYLYSGKNYGGDCAYFVANHPNLGETPVGDNATASIRINGEYTAWLYEDTDYGGVYDEIGVSEPDLSWRSLYGQYSSIKLSVLQHCSDETQPGIYLYSSANYGGSCKYYIEDCPDLDLMPVSIRLVGPFWARIYGQTNYQGPYEEFNESEPDMDWRSLGRNWHSMEVMVDATPPDTSITSGPSGVIPIGSATFTWTGSDDRTSTAELGYRWRLLGLSNDWSSWSHGTSVTYNDLTDGYYTFGVKARDVAHNEDPSPANQSFFVDTTPPDTTITSGPNGCIGIADVTFTWTGSDNRTPTADLLYSCKLEGFDDWSAWMSDTSTSYTGLPDGDYTFKVKAKDGVGHEDPSPAARSFRVDTTPPTGSVLVNGGDSTTNKIAVHLDISGDDGPVGCGVMEMRLSNDGFNWEAWQPFVTEGEWLLPTLNRTTWMVHLQLKDLVGNVSGVFTDAIYLDLYPPRPSSESYQLGARVVAAGDPTSSSESYGLLSATMGQPIADGRLQGAAYHLESGYQGAWPSVPRGRLPAESYDINPSVMASSGGSQQSESYRLWGTSGQPADHDQPSSESYQLFSGFWGMKSAPCRLSCDFNGNGRVDVGDIMFVASCWRCQRGDECYNEDYDLDQDDDIDVVDIMMVVAHWGETCP